MENPYEQQQKSLLSRIVTNVSKLNTSITQLNERLEQLNKENDDVIAIAQMWCSYDKSARIHLESTKSLSAPL